MDERFDVARHDDLRGLLLALIVAVALLTDATGALASNLGHHNHKRHGHHTSRQTGGAAHRRSTGRRVNVPPAPAPTSSHYMSRPTGRTSFRLGCGFGARVRSGLHHPKMLVILDYGMPMHHKGQYGTSAFGPFRSMGQVAYSVETYARGFVWCSGLKNPQFHVRVGIGTSNYGRDVTFRHGQLWGMLVTQVNAWLERHRMANRVRAYGADDIEPGWRGPRATRRWIRGYASRTKVPYYEYGGAAGCPPYHHCLGGWTMEDLWYAAWGSGLSRPLPEIYAETGVNARQWYQLSLYGYRRHGHPMHFAGVLSQLGACRHRRGCAGIRNRPEEAFAQLYRALNADPRTAQPLRWVTDITWRT